MGWSSRASVVMVHPGGRLGKRANKAADSLLALIERDGAGGRELLGHTAVLCGVIRILGLLKRPGDIIKFSETLASAAGYVRRTLSPTLRDG